MSDSSLYQIYQFFIVLLGINLIIFLALYAKPKFIFRRSRMSSEEIEIPQWVWRMSLINLILSGLCLGIISFFIKLMNTMIIV
jgi:hypothetical protein